MAEGPVPANESSQDKSSHREDQEPVIVEPDVMCGHCKRELDNPYLLCCQHSVCKDCLPNLEVKDNRLKCTQCEDTSTHCNDRKMVGNECRVDSLHCVPVPNGPLARYIKGLKVAEHLQRTTIPCGNKTCKSTNKPSESAVFCVECSLYLCPHCRDSHEALAYLIGPHIMKPLDEVRSLDPSTTWGLSSQRLPPPVPVPNITEKFSNIAVNSVMYSCVKHVP